MRTLLILLAMFAGSRLQAVDMTQVLRPGWLRYQVEGLWDGLDLSVKTPSQNLNLKQSRYQAPLRIFYGASEGVELFIDLPFVWNRAAGLQGDTALLGGFSGKLEGTGFGDGAFGIKIKLLEDTGRSPAFFVETLVKLPTGESSLYAFSRSLAGEQASRGTGSGSFDMAVAATFSAYLRPFEGFMRLELVSRGGDQQWAAGAENRVDYGMQTRVRSGLEADLGKNWILALDSQTTIYSADTWTVDGVDVLAGLGSTASSFSQVALAQADLHLHNTTEWYTGPRIQWRMADAFSIALRGEAGLTRASSPFRVSLTLSGYFLLVPGKNLLFSRNRGGGAGGSDASIEAVTGNLQRYIFGRFDSAQEARSKGDWKTFANEVAALEQLDPTPPQLLADIASMTKELESEAFKAMAAGENAAEKKQWLAAVGHWNRARELRPDLPEIKASFEKHQAAIAQAARKIYLKGIELYVEKEDSAAAVKQWQDALLLVPDDEKILDSIKKAQKKIKAINKLK